MTVFDRDAAGFPVLLAQQPKAVTEPSASAPPVAPSAGPSVKPPGVDHIEWARRQDAVRDAAREFETLSAQDIKERLRGQTNKALSAADIETFRLDVRAQQLDDLIDVLDQNQRGALRARRTVRVRAPRGYVRKTLKALTASEIAEMGVRLKARGWTDKQVTALGVDPSKPPADVPATAAPEQPVALAQSTAQPDGSAQAVRFEFERDEAGRLLAATRRPAC